MVLNGSFGCFVLYWLICIVADRHSCMKLDWLDNNWVNQDWTMQTVSFYLIFGAFGDGGEYSIVKKIIVRFSAREMSRPLVTCTTQDCNKRHHLFVTPFGYVRIKRGRYGEIKETRGSSPAPLPDLTNSYISSLNAPITLSWAWTT